MKKLKNYRSDYLFADSGFLIGVGSVINLAGSYFSYSTSSTETEADYRALESDWGMVGQDIRKALVRNSKDKKQAV